MRGVCCGPQTAEKYGLKRKWGIAAEMKNPFTHCIVIVAGLLVFSSVAAAQTPQAQPKQGNEARSPWKFYPTDRAFGDGGPAPKRDLTGTWAGPGSGSGIPGARATEQPSLTPLGQQLMGQNKPLSKFSPAGTNDPHVRYCDPFGLPQNMVNEIRGMSFATMPNRVVIMLQFQDVWREIWTDGRALPTNVGASVKGALDPRYNGYSVGHWEDDYTFVVDSTGLDDRTWVTAAGYPHTIDAHVQERYKRTDHNSMQLTITIDDPKIYTKPFSLGTYNFRWIPNQQLDEWLCLPSDTEEYLKTMGDPAGSDPNAAPQRRTR
jgi:hypothetical protein